MDLSTTLTNTNWSASCSTACLGQKTISRTPEPRNEQRAHDYRLKSQHAAPLAAPPSPQPRALSAISVAARLRSGRRTKDAVRPLAFSSLPIWSGRPGYLEPKHLCAPPNKNTFLSSTLTCGGFSFLRTLPLKCLDFKRRFLFILAHE